MGKHKHTCYYCFEKFDCDPKKEQEFRESREILGCPSCMKISLEERREKHKLIISRGIKRICPFCLEEFLSYTNHYLDICPACKISKEKHIKETEERISKSPIIIIEFVCLECGKQHTVEIPRLSWTGFRSSIISDLHGSTKLPFSDDRTSKNFEIIKQMCPTCISKTYFNEKHNWRIDHHPADYWDNHDTYYYQSKFITPPWVYPGGKPRIKTIMDI